jgi:hypothetical protein
MSNQNPNLEGLRYVAWARVSTVNQVERSPEDQLAIIRAFATRHGMGEEVEVCRFDGVSAANPTWIDKEIDRLIERRRQRGDVGALLVQDASRLTRAGADHLGSIRYRLDRAGIRLVIVTNHVEDPTADALVRTVEAVTSREENRRNAYAKARGLASSVRDGSRPPLGRIPFGVARYVDDENGNPLYVIQDLPDGTQVQRDFLTDRVLKRFGRGARSHWRRQPNERIVLGFDQDARPTVVMIYWLHFLGDWGTRRIADRLNELRRPSPTNKTWTEGMVQAILDRPIYTGRLVANRTTAARFYQVSVGEPEAVHLGPEELTDSGRPSRRVRPRTDWHEEELEAMKTFLPEDVRGHAQLHHDEILDRQASGRKANPRRDAARESDYLLTGLLVAQPGGYAMTGTRGGRDNAYRYYRVSPRDRKADGREVLSRRINADQIEAEVLQRVQDMFAAIPDLESRISTLLRVELDARREEIASRSRLESELERLRGDVRFLVSRRAELGDSTVEAGLKDLSPKIESVEQQLSQLVEVPEPSETEIAESAAVLAAEIRERVGMFDEVDPATVRLLLREIVGELTIDLESCEIHLKLRLPAGLESGRVGALANALLRACKQTHRPLVLATASEAWPKGPCCRRRKAAA